MRLVFGVHLLLVRLWWTLRDLVVRFVATRAILFYGTHFGEGAQPLPRAPTHIWALYHEESPQNNWKLVFPEVIQLFNFTSTYSAGSTWPIPLIWAPDYRTLLERKPIPTAKKSTAGLAPAVFVQSNCNVASDRTRYVKELMNYMGMFSPGVVWMHAMPI